MRKRPGFPARSRVSWEAWPSAELPGWRRSADRTRLQPDSLLTGNFTGNLVFSSLPGPISWQEVAVLQRLFTNSLRKLTGKMFEGTGNSFAGTGNFSVAKR
jgi:hypothetical protein